jgi:glucan-binding YG repeat protein
MVDNTTGYFAMSYAKNDGLKGWYGYQFYQVKLANGRLNITIIPVIVQDMLGLGKENGFNSLQSITYNPWDKRMYMVVNSAWQSFDMASFLALGRTMQTKPINLPYNPTTANCPLSNANPVSGNIGLSRVRLNSNMETEQIAFHGSNVFIDGVTNSQIYVATKVPSLKKGADGKWYGYSAAGVKLTGMQKIQGNWYYLNPARNGAVTYGQAFISGVWYLFNRSTGAMMYESQYDAGNWYFFDSASGRMAKGIQKVGTKYYFYDYATGILKKGQVRDAKGNWYLFSRSTGEMLTGGRYDAGAWYYFAPDTGIMQKGQQKVGANWYLYDRGTGKLRYGLIKDIDGRTYYFDPKTGAMRTGTLTINGRKMTFSPYLR